MTETASPTPRPLPGYVVLLIGLATLILWLCLLAVVLAMIWSGTGLDLTSLVPASVEPAMRTAMHFQYGVIFLNLVVLFVLGNLICLAWLAGTHGIAVGAAIWLIRVIVAVTVLSLFSSVAVPFAVGGSISAAPSFFMQLPSAFVSIGFLIFAERMLVLNYAQR